jgi:asparagine synthetase B (glutamine-hydrolysing)
MTRVRVLGELDPCFAWDGQTLYDPADLGPGAQLPPVLRGAAGSLRTAGDDPERWRLVRDPLGIGKLFWAAQADGTVVFAARPWRLIEGGHALEEIQAVPRGCVLDHEPGVGEAVERSLHLPTKAFSSEEASGREIRAALDAYLAAIAAAHPSATAFVCLSGGLDSSGVAALVRSQFPDAVAVSFDLEGDAGPSDDRLAGARVARELGMPLLEASASAEELLDHLDTVLRDGIDWRDFNVHAGLVNSVLAVAIADASGSGEPIVFTGDLANELLADYGPERYRGEVYYELPRLPPRALRASLVRGLDSSHREVGVFGAWRLPVVQPYAVACDSYLSLPERFLRLPDRKQRLARATFGDLLPEHVLSRPKARAQLGGEHGGGVLAACVDRGLDAAELRRRFCTLHAVADAKVLDTFIRAGLYRSSLPSSGVHSPEPA